MNLKELIDMSEGYDPESVEILILIEDYHDEARSTIMGTHIESACLDRPNSRRRKIIIQTLFGL